MSSAGNFEIVVEKGGYPAWCRLFRDGQLLVQLHHNELSDLEYVVKKAMHEARSALPERYQNEV